MLDTQVTGHQLLHEFHTCHAHILSNFHYFIIAIEILRLDYTRILGYFFIGSASDLVVQIYCNISEAVIARFPFKSALDNSEAFDSKI